VARILHYHYALLHLIAKDMYFYTTVYMSNADVLMEQPVKMQEEYIVVYNYLSLTTKNKLQTQLFR